jgi:hypothetical protein
MLMGAIVGLLAFASGPVASAPLPTPAPVSDRLTVILCGAVLGEPFETTKARLGEPARNIVDAGITYWLYTVDDGAADCIFRIANARVVEIFASSVNGQPDPQMADPYGVQLGSSDYDLIALRGDRFVERYSPFEPIRVQFTYPSKSGACWSYTFGHGLGSKDVIVTGIRVYLNLEDSLVDCNTP